MSLADYTWYNVFNSMEFEAEGLVSKEYTVEFEGIGEKNILVTKGNVTSVLFDDIFLTINLNNNNPFELDDRAVYVDSDSEVWLGILNEN